MGTPAVDKLSLMRWRAMEAAAVIQRLADYAKQDPDFAPTASHHTTRWHARFGCHEFELLCTEAKFFDTNANHGGGGAIDLAMHCLRLDFKAAIRLLRRKGV
jgi:hypothetical protein